MLSKGKTRQLVELAHYLGKDEVCFNHGIGYSSGSLGIFLFLHEYSRFSGDQVSAEQAQRILQHVIEQAFTVPAEFVRDATEFGLLLLHLFEEGYLPPEMNFLLVKLDAFLALQLIPCLERHDFDQFTGYLAIGRYFLKRCPLGAPAGPELTAIIDNLLACCQTSSDGNYWRSKFRARGVIDFSWSHGMAGVLLFLAEYIEAGASYRLAEVQQVLRGSITFMLRHERPFPQAMYPDVVGEQAASTLNLCYGALGIAYALWRAASALALTAVQTVVLGQLLILAERRRAAACQVYDASMIYGSSGNMLLFNKLFIETQQPAFKQATTYWYGQRRRLCQHQGYVAGFRNQYNRGLARTYPSLFEGLAGFGLALLQYAVGDLGLLGLIGY